MSSGINPVSGNRGLSETAADKATASAEFNEALLAATPSGTQFGQGSNPALRAGAQALVAQYTSFIASGQVRDAPALATVLASIEDKIINSPSQLIVAYEGTPQAQRVIGVLSYETTNFGQRAIEVDGMLVDPALQRSGRRVGTQLLQAVWDRVWPGRSDKVIRLVSIPSAVGFYQSIGGEVRTRPNAWPVIEFNQRPGGPR